MSTLLSAMFMMQIIVFTATSNMRMTQQGHMFMACTIYFHLSHKIQSPTKCSHTNMVMMFKNQIIFIQ